MGGTVGCMAQMGLDKWLKGLDDLTSLDPANLEQRLADLRQEQDAIQLKIAVLSQLLQRARQHQRDTEVAAARDFVAAPGGAATPPPANGSLPDSRPPERPASWKRDAVLALMREDSSREWSAEEIRRVLNERGIMQGDEGTTTRVVLRRLAERGDVIKVGRATYAIHRPTFPAYVTDHMTPQ